MTGRALPWAGQSGATERNAVARSQALTARSPTPREARALAIRDAARRKLRLCGRCEEVRGAGPTLFWRGRGLMISLREPRLGGRYVYGIDIWLANGVGVRKVLNLEWNRDGAWIVSFRRGPWEELVLALR